MKWNPFSLRDEACEEAYKYFDKNIRPLPKKSDGSFNAGADIFVNSDVDAFRHAYVSGIFTQEYGANVASIFGNMQEMLSFFRTTGGGSTATNMDYWNNAVGRKYGKQTRKKETLAKALHEALNNGEMIIDLKDKRRYQGSVKAYKVNPLNPVIVLKQNETGRNLIFFDTSTKTTMTRVQFVSLIKKAGILGIT
jgi:hypothetical protein